MCRAGLIYDSQALLVLLEYIGRHTPWQVKCFGPTLDSQHFCCSSRGAEVVDGDGDDDDDGESKPRLLMMKLFAWASVERL